MRKIIFTLFIFIFSDIVFALESKQIDVAPIPIQEFSIDTTKNENKTDKHNNEIENKFNRDAIIKNWDCNFFWNENSYIAEYTHSSKTKSIVIRLVKEIEGAPTASDTIKIYTKRYNGNLNDIKMKSKELYTVVVDFNKSKKEEKSIENMSIKPFFVEIIVHKTGPGEPYTVMFAMGKNEDQDIKYIAEDFFIRVDKANLEKK